MDSYFVCRECTHLQLMVTTFLCFWVLPFYNLQCATVTTLIQNGISYSFSSNSGLLLQLLLASLLASSWSPQLYRSLNACLFPAVACSLTLVYLHVFSPSIACLPKFCLSTVVACPQLLPVPQRLSIYMYFPHLFPVSQSFACLHLLPVPSCCVSSSCCLFLADAYLMLTVS